MRTNRLFQRLLWTAALMAGSLTVHGAPRAAESGIRTIDLKAGASGVAFIAPRAEDRGFAVGFQGCAVALLDSEAQPAKRWDDTGCKVLFTVHPGQAEGAETVVASDYLGQAVVLGGAASVAHPAQTAATTDAFSTPDGILASSDDGSVRLLPTRGQEKPRVLASGTGVARVLLPDPKARVGTPAFFVGFDTGEVQAVGRGRIRRYRTGVGRINGLALSGDGRTLYAGGFDGRVRTVDLASGRARDLVDTRADVNAIAVDALGRHLAAVNDAGHVLVIDLASGRTERDLVLSPSPVTAVAFGPDASSVLAGDAQGLLHLVPLRDPAQAEAAKQR